MTTELSPDQKGQASLNLGEVIQQSRENFPDKRYHPKVYLDTPQYHIYGINPAPFEIWPTGDGVGTKPELAERLSIANAIGDAPNYDRFANLAFDTLAMVDGDEARFGRQMLGVVNIIDTNIATPEAIYWLATGLRDASNTGRFAVLNGETAELGYRTSGYGPTRINWNAVGVSLVIPDKLILGQKLEVGQPLVAFREKSIRSNGLTRIRTILEAAFLQKLGYTSKEDYFLSHLAAKLEDKLSQNKLNPLKDEVTVELAKNAASPDMIQFLDKIMGHSFMEQVLLPWHVLGKKVLYELLEPSTLYGKVIHEAQGWTKDKKQLDITGAAHITGGGIPEKVKRMVEPHGLGACIEPVFPDPKAITRIYEIAKDLPEETREGLMNDQEACQQWNRGIGFVVATKTKGDAKRLISLAGKMGYEAVIAGKVTDKPQIEFRGHIWTY